MHELKKYLNIAEGFQYSVNIEYDLGNEEKIKSFIPTTSSFDIIEEIMLSTHVSSTDRARILIGAYGKGKSNNRLSSDIYADIDGSDNLFVCVRFY